MSATRLPLAYLVTCSEMSLESVELSRLNRAANLRKEFHQILEEWVDSEVDARLARSLLEWKREQESDDAPRIENTPAPARFQQLAIAFLPESSATATHAAQICDSQSPRTDARTNGVAHTERAQSPARFPKPDQTIAPCRWPQRAIAADAKLREVEHFAECTAASLQEGRGKCATHNADALSRPEPAARPRKKDARASAPASECGAGAIEFVPLCAEREEPHAPTPRQIRTDGSPARHILGAQLDEFHTKMTRSGRPAPRAISRHAEYPSVHFRVRQ